MTIVQDRLHRSYQRLIQARAPTSGQTLTFASPLGQGSEQMSKIIRTTGKHMILVEFSSLTFELAVATTQDR